MTILQAVLQKLTRKQHHFATESQTQKGSIDFSELVERYAPLMELQAKRQLIEVEPIRQNPDRKQLFQSMILEINLGSGYLLLDDLFPTDDNLNLQAGDELTIKHHSNGQLLTFTSKVLYVSTSHGSLCYALELPEEVGYRQRRIYQRLSLSQQQPLSVRLLSPWRTPWYATVQNISSGGMRMVVGGNVLQQLSRDSLLPMCEFKFNNDFQIRCQARVRGFRFSRRPYRQTQLSVEFVDLAPLQRLQLQQFINAVLTGEPVAA